MTLRVGTRDSALARAQTAGIITQLKALDPSLAVETVLITTAGDRAQSAPPDGAPLKGLFVKELDEALLQGRIDVAVHSFKDIPPGPLGLLAIAAVPRRADPRDAWIARDGTPFAQLKQGARVGTHSPRRRALLKRARPDLEIVPLRGNVDTRLRKLRDEAMDGIVLACAGLARLGLTAQITEPLALDLFLPAAGQGALALVVRAQDLDRPGTAFTALQQLNHAPSYDAALCEHACLEVLSGSCHTPIAVHAAWEGPMFKARGCVLDPEGREACVAEWSAGAHVINPVVAGRELAERLLARGAQRLLRL